MKQNEQQVQLNVLFGNGDIPIHGSIIHILEQASSFICLDGGADKLNSLNYEPNIILGDMDSIQGTYKCKTIKLEDQSKSDLEKGIIWCLENNFKELSLVGFSGGRGDHEFLTLLIMLKYAEKIRLSMYTQLSKVVCVKNKTIFSSEPNQTISIISPKADTLITTSNLKYTLSNEKLSNLSEGISNLTMGNSYSIESSDWVWVFENYPS